MMFRNDIQGLRAVAVLLVFIFHLSSKYLPGGFVGVDVFFVISGYLISNIIIKKISINKFNLWEFYLGRVKRIVPVYYFMLLVVWIVFLFVFSNADTTHFRISHFWAVLFNSNSYFSKVDDYFGASSNENPLLHTWTLAIEMQFYLFLPLLMLLIKNKKLLIVTVLGITAMLFCYATYSIVNGNKVAMYFSLFSRSPEFLLGVLASLVRIEQKRFFIRYSTIIGTLGLIGLFGSAFLFSESSDFPGVYAAIPCVSTILLLATPYNGISKLFSTRPFVFIGEISYSVYLWHWPIMAFLRYYNYRYEFTRIEEIVVICLTIIVASISYYLIERPIRSQKGYRFAFPLITIGVVNVLMIFFIRSMKNKFSEMPHEFLSLSFGMDSNSNTFEAVGVYGGNNMRNKRILLLGDSHAHGFKPYLHALGIKEQFSFRSLTNSFYPTIPAIEKDVEPGDEKLKTYIKLLPHIELEIDLADIIIVYYSAENSHLWSHPTRQFLSKLKHNQRVLFVSDYPSLDKDPARLNKSVTKNKSRVQSYSLSFSILDRTIMETIAEEPNARYVDLSKHNDFFDDAPFYRDTLMYFDSSHLNHFGAVKYQEVSGCDFMIHLNWALSGETAFTSN